MIVIASANAFGKEINLKKQKLAQFDVKLNDLRDEQVRNTEKRQSQYILFNFICFAEIKFDKSFNSNMFEGWSYRNSFDWFYERF